jgi:hypothetical protein
MSEENVEMVKRLYPGPVDVAVALSDPEILEAIRVEIELLMHSDFETVGDPANIFRFGGSGVEIVEGSSRQVAYGFEGLASMWDDWLSAWESWVATPIDFIDVDESRVLVVLDIRARSKTAQVEVPIEGANLLTLRDGKVARVELFLRREEALQAAGLSE